MDNFKNKVFNLIVKVPKGRVVSYGQVASALGNSHMARQVGWALHNLDGNTNIPWWRVVNNKGLITIKGNLLSTADLQKQLLEKEGITVKSDYSFDIEKYRYHI